jgi:uncharacterized membrane protein
MDGPNNVLAVSFEDDSEAYEALTDLKQLDTQGQIDLRAAAVVVRGEDGRLQIKDQVAEHPIEGAATGGILGLLIGILGGPFGILIGGLIGLLAGSLFDLDHEEHTESVLSEVSRSVRVGRTTLLAEATEPSPEIIDAAMARLKGTVTRYGVGHVEAEIAAAEDAERAARHKARQELHERRHEKREAEIHAKVEELKAKLHPHKDTAGAGTSA